MIHRKFVNLEPLKFEKKQSIFAFILSFVFIFVLIAMVIQPDKYIGVSLNALLVWATVVLPAIFPFLLYTRFLTQLGLVDLIAKAISPITKFLFHTDGISAYVYVVSIISGYPVGAKLIADLYEDGRMNHGNALRTMTYCANCGPMFIIGTVGIGMFFSATVGYFILISHMMGAVINGLVFRNYKLADTSSFPQKNKGVHDDNFLYNTSISACNSMLIVGTYIVIFFILIEFISSFFYHGQTNIIFSLMNGFLEITHGCQDLSRLPISLNLKAILGTLIITFGGLSTTFQSLSFLKKMKFSTPFFLFIKFTHAIFSTLICVFLLLLFPL